MPRPLSFDLRERVSAALLEGSSARSVAKRFGVSVATAVRLGQTVRSGGDLTPRRMGGYRRRMLGPEIVAWMRSRLEEKSDLTVRALTLELADVHGITVTHDTVWRYMRRLGLSFKKNAAGERAGWSEDRTTAPALENPPA